MRAAALQSLCESRSGLCPGAVKKILRHKMIEDSRKAVAAHARRFAVGLGLTDEQIRKDLPKIVFDTLALDIDKDPEDFLAKTYAVQQKNRLIEDERFDVEKYQRHLKNNIFSNIISQNSDELFPLNRC
ncbi:MAG: hypothetical protein COA93_10295 [Alphaproteobacteria bacterium]|nr:MAG: hypothetical protein COA93_10295 [Alphaproteobacteria bacterium]